MHITLDDVTNSINLDKELLLRIKNINDINVYYEVYEEEKALYGVGPKYVACIPINEYIHLKVSHKSIGYNVDAYTIKDFNFYLVLILDMIEKDINRDKVRRIKQKYENLLGTFSLITLHKNIYEHNTHSNWDPKGFIEQAGSYEGVLRSFKQYSDQIDKLITQPIIEIEKDNDEGMNKYNLDQLCNIKIEIIYF